MAVIVVLFILEDTPTSECYVPTFRNTLSGPAPWFSETSSYKIQIPGSHPKEIIQNSQQGVSFKSRMTVIVYKNALFKNVTCFGYIGLSPAVRFIHVAVCLTTVQSLFQSELST
jgi:hypothetical protein